jgi:hypothetical protein
LPFWNGIAHAALAVSFAGVTPGFGFLKPVLELLEHHVVAGANNFGLDVAVDVNPRIALDPLDGGAFAVPDVTELALRMMGMTRKPHPHSGQPSRAQRDASPMSLPAAEDRSPPKVKTHVWMPPFAQGVL